MPSRGRARWRTFTLTGAADDRSVLGAVAASGGAFETATLCALRRMLPADAVVLDIGANIGAFALALASPEAAGSAFDRPPQPGYKRIVPESGGAG